MARFDSTEDFFIQGFYSITGKKDALEAAYNFLENWYDNSWWLYDHPNSLKDFLIDLMEHLGVYTRELLGKYPNTNAWMAGSGWDDDDNPCALEIYTEGFMKGQTDAIVFFCDAYGLTYKYEETDTHDKSAQ